jgi:ATP-dependent helicase Lhr and Lhr-like helicase
MNEQQIFTRLAPFVQEFIYRSAWQELRPVQLQTAQAILDSNDDVLVTTGTASGKTEAAFLPILSLIQAQPGTSVQALYVGPLRALINDQFKRLEPLCEQGRIPLHRWHGEVSAAQKKKLLQAPGGVLQITPESIESLLLNKTAALPRLFGDLRFVVIDETHTFLNSDRGIQLASQLRRLERYVKTGRPRRIGLSATIGDAAQACQWLNFQQPQQVQLVNPAAVAVDTRISLLHLKNEQNGPSKELAADLYALTRNQRSLIFCNDRDGVEKLTHTLNRSCSRDQLNERYLPHHSSISKELREEAERRMQGHDLPASVVCTSTLELGIDIGQLDLVAQVNSTASVSSFAQRIGRSGRRLGNARTMQVYATDTPPQAGTPFYEAIPFSLLQALAVIELFLGKWVEPPSIGRRAYNVLYQQIMSYLAEKNGALPQTLVKFFLQSGVFPDVTVDDYEQLLRYLAHLDHLEQLPDGNLIVGLAGERILRARDFYAVFQSPPDWTVLQGTKNVGTVAPSPNLQVGETLILSGRTWEITEILPLLKQVLVKAAGAAERTYFSPTGGYEIHPCIGQKMRELLQTEIVPGYLSDSGKIALSDARKLARSIGLERLQYFELAEQAMLFHWTGTRAARALVQMLKEYGLLAKLERWVITIKPSVSSCELKDIFSRFAPSSDKPLPELNRDMLCTRKFDEYLPETLLRQRAAREYFDFVEAKQVAEKLASSL